MKNLKFGVLDPNIQNLLINLSSDSSFDLNNWKVIVETIDRQLDQRKLEEARVVLEFLLSDYQFTDRIKIDLQFLELKYYTFANNFEKALTIQDDIKTQLRKINQHPDTVDLLFRYYYLSGNLSSLSSDFTKALMYHSIHFTLAKSNNNDKQSSLAFYSLGGVYLQLGEYTKSKHFFKRAITLLKKQKNYRKLSGALTNIGSIYSSIGRYAKALDLYEEALKIQERYYPEFKANLSLKYFNIGVTYYRCSRFENAISYLEKSITYREEIKDTRGLAWSHTALALVYLGLGNIPESFQNLQTSLDYAKEANDNSILLQIYNNFALLHYQQGNLITAKDFLDKSMEIQKHVKRKTGVYHSYKLLAQINRLQYNYSKAENYLDEAYELALKWDNAEYLAQCIKEKALILADTKKTKDAIIKLQEALNKLEQKDLTYDTLIGEILFHLIRLTLNLHDQISHIFLKKFDEFTELNPIIEVYQQLSNAVILEDSERLSQKFEAMAIFKQITDLPNIPFPIRYYSTLKLFALLLKEYEYQSNPMIIQELEELFGDLYKKLTSNKMNAYLIELMILMVNVKLTNTTNHDIINLLKKFEHSIAETQVSFNLLSELYNGGQPKASKYDYDPKIHSIPIHDVLYSKPRSEIVYILMTSVTGLTYQELLQNLQISNSALSRHLKFLEEQEYIISERVFTENRPTKIYQITNLATREISNYAHKLSDYLSKLLSFRP